MFGAGEIRGLDQALLDCLRAYKPSPEGPDGVSSQIILGLPISDWAHFQLVEFGEVSVPAASSVAVTVRTIPQDQRHYLEHVLVFRATGDNTIQAVQIVYPAGNIGAGTSSTGGIQLKRLITAGTLIYWPDRRATQAVLYSMEVYPLLLEPGSLVQILPAGAGAGASTFTTAVLTKGSKLIPAKTPVPD